MSLRTGQEDIFGFAMRIADQWQLGSAKQDNGLLIAIAVNDRRMQIHGLWFGRSHPALLRIASLTNKSHRILNKLSMLKGSMQGCLKFERIFNLHPEVAAQAAQELQERQDQANSEQEAKSKTFSTAFIYLIAGAIGIFCRG